MKTLVEPFSPSALVEAAKVVKRGGVIVFPTDTVYGLGCDPFDEPAVERLFRAKGRGDKPIPVLCSGIRDAAKAVRLGPVGLSLAREFWPGALTIVAPAKAWFPSLVDQGKGEVGVRVPALQACRALIRACGGYISGTSANVSGDASARTASDALRQLNGRVDLILDGGPLRGKESTVVRVDRSTASVIRQGTVRVRRFLLSQGVALTD